MHCLLEVRSRKTEAQKSLTELYPPFGIPIVPFL